MLTKLRKQQKGFTIVEVLIVLAIAALILLIVFLAVPALQRNSRNTQRRDDVAKLLGIVTEYQSNSNGGTPARAFCFGEMVLDNGTVGGNTTTSPGAFYCKSSGTSISKLADGTTANTSTVDTAQLVFGVVCGANGNGTSGSARNFAIYYTLEANTKSCQQS